MRQGARRGTRPASPPISAMRAPISSPPFVQPAASGRRSRCPSSTPRRCSSILDEITSHVTQESPRRLGFSTSAGWRLAWHTTAKLDLPSNITLGLHAVRAGTEPGRKHLAVPARQLALKPRLRNLRRHHRRRLRRLAKTHRPAKTITSIGRANGPYRLDPIKIFWYQSLQRSGRAAREIS